MCTFQVVCGVCHSFSGHLFERLGGELGIVDGMTMKNDFCEELVDACQGQIPFPSYENGDDYCEKHTGGATDKYWSFPYMERECLCSALMIHLCVAVVFL